MEISMRIFVENDRCAAFGDLKQKSNGHFRLVLP